MEQQNKYYENQLELINVSLENSSILRHDMKNHLQAIFTDIKNGNIIEAQQHISDITDVYNSDGEIRLFGSIGEPPTKQSALLDNFKSEATFCLGYFSVLKRTSARCRSPPCVN